MGCFPTVVQVDTSSSHTFLHFILPKVIGHLDRGDGVLFGLAELQVGLKLLRT